MNETQDEAKLRKAKKILSVISLALIAFLVIGLLVSAFTHAEKGTILAFLFTLMAVPFVFYACLTYLRHKEDFLKKIAEEQEKKS